MIKDQTSTERAFGRLMRSRKLRRTAARLTVLREALAMHGHFEAEDLLVRLRQRGRRVSRGTIYRTLKLLVECGLLREVAFVDRHTHYEFVLGHRHHEHLICVGCGRVIEFSNRPLERKLGEVCRSRRFIPLQHKLEVTGYCEECARRKMRARSGSLKGQRRLSAEGRVHDA